MKSFFSVIIVSIVVLLLSCKKTELQTPIPEPAKPVTPTEKLPIITAIAPLTAEIGDTLTLTGTSFGTDINVIKVYFPLNLAVVPKSVTDTKILVVIPATAISGQLSVSVNNSSSVRFKDAISIVSIAPSIKGYSPNLLKVGDEVTITGNKLGNDPSKMFIQFANGIKINPKSLTPTEIKFILPATASAGKLTVITENGTVLSINDFNAIFPNIDIVKIDTFYTRVGGSFGYLNTDGYNKNQIFQTTFTNPLGGRIRTESATNGNVSISLRNNAETLDAIKSINTKSSGVQVEWFENAKVYVDIEQVENGKIIKKAVVVIDTKNPLNFISGEHSFDKVWTKADVINNAKATSHRFQVYDIRNQ